MVIKKVFDVVSSIKTTGMIIPSSKYLVRKTVNKINFNKNKKILQLGFGTGILTKEIVKHLNKNTELIIFEIDKKFNKYYKPFEGNKQIKYIEDSAEFISKYFNKGYFDVIISTLPFSLFNKQLANKIRNEIKNSLKSGGKFIQYQYSLQSKNHFKKLFNNKIKIDFVLLNIPPAFIFEVYKK